jgi:nucleoside-diphosphate-sugar epimerase
MVIGNGLLAQAFAEFADRQDVTVFASGVSNSNERNEEAYERELRLLLPHLHANARLIYFSTVSVFDPSLRTSRYIEHKLKVEESIAKTAVAWLVFRLPIVVGQTTNPFTLTNFLYNRIRNNEPFELHRNACRYLIDVEDVRQTLLPIVESPLANKVFNVHFGQKTTLPDLVAAFENLLGQKACSNVVEKGTCYDVPNGDFLALVDPSAIPAAGYVHRVLRRYYTK